MAGFVLLSGPGVENAWEHPISSLTLAVNDMIELDVGATTWTVADSSTQHWQKKAVCLSAATSSDTLVNAIDVLPGQLWLMDVANAANSAHNGDRMVLSDQNTVNNTGTDSTAQTAVVVQRYPETFTDTTSIVGEIVYGVGVDPDAT